MMLDHRGREDKDVLELPEMEAQIKDKLGNLVTPVELTLIHNFFKRALWREVQTIGWWTARDDNEPNMPSWRYASIICRDTEDLNHKDYKAIKLIERWLSIDLVVWREKCRSLV